MEAPSEDVYCKMHDGDRQTDGGRERGREEGKKKNYLDSPFIYSEDNHVTIVASSNFLIKVPRFSSEPSNHIHASFWGVELFLSAQSILLFLILAGNCHFSENLCEQTTATYKQYLEACNSEINTGSPREKPATASHHLSDASV